MLRFRVWSDACPHTPADICDPCEQTCASSSCVTSSATHTVQSQKSHTKPRLCWDSPDTTDILVKKSVISSIEHCAFTADITADLKLMRRCECVTVKLCSRRIRKSLKGAFIPVQDTVCAMPRCVWWCLLLSVLSATGSDVTGPDKDRLPNFVLMMVDDLGIGDIGCYGNDTIRFDSHIDRLASEGVRLTQHLSAAPLCTPSRTAFLTGRYALRSGKWHQGVSCENRTDHCHHPNFHGFSSFYGLPFTWFNDCVPGHGSDILVDLQTTLQKLTVLLGLGLVTLICARCCSLLDLSSSLLLSLILLFLLLAAVWMMPLRLLRRWNCVLMRDREVVEQPLRADTLPLRLLREAQDFIHRNKERPFLLFFSLVHIHTPLFKNPQFLGKSRHGLYGDNLEEMDWIIGGKAMGGWEGGIRVPGIFRWPGRLPPGREVHEPTSLMDLYPTLKYLARDHRPDRQTNALELVCLNPLLSVLQTVDGHNLMPLLEGTSHRSEHEFMFHYCGVYLNAVRWHPPGSDSIYKAHLFTPNFSPEGAVGCYHTHVCMCHGDHVTPQTPPLLYELTSDPSESRPLSPQTDPRYYEALERVDRAVRAHGDTLREHVHPDGPSAQLSWSRIVWRPWLQPCCGTFPFCGCEEQDSQLRRRCVFVLL
ncbi:hypothetical protein WMY93_017692 [Mugilogobius chulae]|uniref:Sulfatase N-terminal domain-containing protein n=1 Tax=Mugilogobius chulae TaxID=88201 RepID=A0AAW0NNX7_9GOBI